MTNTYLGQRLSFFQGDDPLNFVVDTLQMIRGISCNNTYANGCRDLSALKRIAAPHGIAILPIHHLRKETDDWAQEEKCRRKGCHPR